MWDLHDRLGGDVSSRACTALIESIKTQGQKQPVLGRRLTDGSEDDIELIYGARRLLAAREIGVDLLVEIRNIDDRDALIEMDIENRVREDITPYERGLSYKRWLRSGLFDTQSEIAKALGVSEAQVSRLLKYADLPAVLLAAFRSPGDIREEWAGELWKLCKDEARRPGVLRRARQIAASAKRPTAKQVYEILVDDDMRKVRPSRARDEVVKCSRGRPLFRIGFRTKSVHLILPKSRLTPEALDDISDQLRTSLESFDTSRERDEHKQHER